MAKGADTRLELMRAAERLFAERSVQAVSLREVTAAAGQRNVSAVVYHFGSKLELLECVLERHSLPIQDEFLAQLRALENAPKVCARTLVEILVRPLAAKLDDPDGGRHYLALCAQLAASPEFPLTERRVAHAPGAAALTERMLQVVGPIDPLVFPFRMMRFASMLYLSFADYMRLTKVGFLVPREVFVDDLVEALVQTVSVEVR
jgi:AcrR family transcriptional regulator